VRPSITILVLIMLLGSRVYSQYHSFSTGEELKYRAYYKLGFIWIYAGDVRFSIRDTSCHGGNSFHLVSAGKSLSKYHWIYKVDDSYESVVSQIDLQPCYFERKTFEGDDFTHNIYSFDKQAGKIHTNTTNQDQPQKLDTLEMKGEVFDVLSAIYHCRDLDYAGMEKGDRVPVKMIVDNVVHELYINYHGTDSIKDRNKREHSCYKFSIVLVRGTLFKGGEELLVWLSKDERKIPLLVRSRVVVGSVNAYFWEE